MVREGSMPFLEKGGPEQLARALKLGMNVTTDTKVCEEAQDFILVTGTSVDEHHNPKISELTAVFDSYSKYFKAHGTVIIRSTVYPGSLRYLRERLQQHRISTHLAFCPERVAQGSALEEIGSLPQIVAAFDEESFERAYAIFRRLSPCILRLEPKEAEMAKLMNNAWRYLEFAIANEFYALADEQDLDFYKIFDTVRYGYPRGDGYCAPGLAAGPCLFKDAMQMSAMTRHRFLMAESAMVANEGLADVVVSKARKMLGGCLKGRRIGLLGMTFKPDCDDTRESLCFKILKELQFETAEVQTFDPYLTNKVSLQELLDHSELLILGVPHREFRKLVIDKPVVDVWGVFGRKPLDILPGTSQDI